MLVFDSSAYVTNACNGIAHCDCSGDMLLLGHQQIGKINNLKQQKLMAWKDTVTWQKLFKKNSNWMYWMASLMSGPVIMVLCYCV